MTQTLTAADDWDAILARATRSRGEDVMLWCVDDIGCEGRYVGEIDADHPDDDMRDVYVRTDDGSYAVDGELDRVFRGERCVGREVEIIFKDDK